MIHIKTLSIAIGLLVLGTGFVAFAPTAEAVGWCTSATHDQCGDYIVCVGYRWSYPSYFECTGVGIREPYCPYDCITLP